MLLRKICMQLQKYQHNNSTFGVAKQFKICMCISTKFRETKQPKKYGALIDFHKAALWYRFHVVYITATDLNFLLI